MQRSLWSQKAGEWLLAEFEWVDEERWRERGAQGHEEIWEGELHIRDLDFANGFAVVHTCQIISNCTL